LTGTKTFIAGLQSLLIDVDVNVSFAFYAAAFLIGLPPDCRRVIPGSGQEKRTIVLFHYR
jgi:hypothetical protein